MYNNSEENQNEISFKYQNKGEIFKQQTAYQILLFFLSFLGCGYVSLISYVFGIFSASVIVYLLILKPSPVAFAGTVLGFALSLIMSFSVEGVVLFIYYLLPVIPLYICTLRCGKNKVTSYRGILAKDGGYVTFEANDSARTTSSAVMAFVYFLMLAFAFALSVVSLSGTFGLEAMKSYVSAFMDALYKATEEMYVSMGISEENLPLETIKQAIQTVYLLSVALVTVLCLTCGYLSTALLRKLLKSKGLIKTVFPDGYTLKLSVISAFVYAGILAVYMFSSIGESAAVYLTSYNLKIIFSHIFMVYGFGRAMKLLSDKEELYGVYFKVTAIIVAIMFSGLLYVILPVYGAYMLVKDKISKRLKESSDNHDGDDRDE